MNETIVYPNGDFSKVSMIGSYEITPKGVLVRCCTNVFDGMIITNIIETNETKRELIFNEINKMVGLYKEGEFYQPDWDKLLG